MGDTGLMVENRRGLNLLAGSINYFGYTHPIDFSAENFEANMIPGIAAVWISDQRLVL